jgi:glycosyltransferase involved in cell wall biosynthesis
MAVSGNGQRGSRQKISMGIMLLPLAAPTFELFFFNYLDLLKPFCDTVYGISAAIMPRQEDARVTIQDIGTKLFYVKDIQPLWWSILLWLFRLARIQMKMAGALFGARKRIDAVTFCGAAWYLPSMVVAKLLRKRTAVLVWGSGSLSQEKTPGRNKVGEALLSAVMKLETKITLKLADQIDVEASSAISFLGLEKYQNKTVINGAPYVDRNVFHSTKRISERSCTIGFVGRLSEEKGLLNLVGAIPALLRRFEDLTLTIIGDGVLRNRIGEELRSADLLEAVVLIGWVLHSELPRYLNDFKLFVFPSYSEGLPGAVQEAMACGVPVLATNVGAIPDLIKDGETGFIIRTNSPEGIAADVERILTHANLDQVAKNAEEVIKKEYTYEVMAEKCGKALQKLMQSAG